jgi:hypothetical protein
MDIFTIFVLQTHFKPFKQNKMQTCITPLRIETINSNHVVLDFLNYSIFYSYNKEICIVYNGIIYLNYHYWTFSLTTKKHLYKWLKLDRNQINNYLKNGKAFEYSVINENNLPTLHNLINRKSEAI